MSMYTEGTVVVDAIKAWADQQEVSVFSACLTMGIATQSYYGWAHGKRRVSSRLLKRIESYIGPINSKRHIAPKGKLIVDASVFNALVDHVYNAHSIRTNKVDANLNAYIDISIAVTHAKGCIDMILDEQEKDMAEVEK
jgi:hypothetical protein